MPHYFNAKNDAPHDYLSIETEFEGKVFSLLSDSHVFSRKAVDYGTSLLISQMLKHEENRKLNLLDLGCGIGVLGIVLAVLRPGIHLTLSDVNERALAIAKDNAKILGKRQPKIILSDGFANISDDFDLIALNPPIRAGKETCFRLYHEAASHLRAEGSFYIVIRVKQGAASAEAELKRLFSEVIILERSKGYRVYRASSPVK